MFFLGNAGRSRGSLSDGAGRSGALLGAVSRGRCLSVALSIGGAVYRVRAGRLGVGRAELQRCKIIPPIKGEESLSVRVYKASCKRGGART